MNTETNNNPEDNVIPADVPSDSISSEKIGDILKQERIKQGLSLDDIYETLKIRINIIMQIENSDWADLSNSSHLANFSKQYAKMLHLQENGIIKNFDQYLTHNSHINDLNPIDTIKNNAKEPHKRHHHFNKKNKRSGTAKAIYFIIFILVIVAIVGALYAYKNGSFKTTNHITNKIISEKSVETPKAVVVTKSKKRDVTVNLDMDEKNSQSVQSNLTAQTPTAVKKPVIVKKKFLNFQIEASQNIWFSLKNKKSKVTIVARILKKGETFSFPDSNDLLLSVSTPYFVKGILDGHSFTHLSKNHTVLKDFIVNPTNLKKIMK